MSMLVWVMMAIALWHFTVWVPDRFWGGIVGAFLVAVVSSVIFGVIVNGFNVPGRHDTGIAQALIAIPGTLIGLGLSYWYGGKQLEAAERPRPPRRRPQRA